MAFAMAGVAAAATVVGEVHSLAQALDRQAAQAAAGELWALELQLLQTALEAEQRRTFAAASHAATRSLAWSVAAAVEVAADDNASPEEMPSANMVRHAVVARVVYGEAYAGAA